MQKSKIELIKEKCKEIGVDYNSLVSTLFFQSSYKKIINILNMSEWNDPKFRPLLTSTIWLSNFEEVKSILEMKEWNDPKFRLLLTSNIWNSNFKEVKAILEMSEWNDPKFRPLLTSNIWSSNFKEIKSILEMPEWDDPKFQSLLTSTIWTSNFKEVKSILEMPEWDDPRYMHLLTPSILSVKKEKIQKSILIGKYFNIDKFINTKFLTRPLNQAYALAMHLQNNSIPLINENNKLNSIFSYMPGVMKKRYGIDLKELVKLYPMPDDLFDEKENVK